LQEASDEGGLSETLSVIPAKAGIHRGTIPALMEHWIPAFAGMTE